MSDTTDNRAFSGFTPLRFGLLLALLIFAAFPQVVLGLQTFVVRDYGFFVYPLAHFQRECFWRGELPFWDPYNYCGVPFLAQWNTMPLYPPSLIYLTLPLSWGLGFFCLLHLWFAGLGMFFLARRWTGSGFAAAFAGTVFAFNGFSLNLIMWPSHLATFSWMPWVVLAVECAWREGGRKIFLAAVVGAMQMLAGGPEIILFTWILSLLFWTQAFVKRESPRRAMFWRFSLVMALVTLLVAIQLLPFLDLVAHSQRTQGYSDTRWSLPGRGWVNFLVPMAFGNTWDMGVFYQYGQEWTSSYYLGMAALWLALMAFFGGRERRVWLLGAAAAVAFVFALGENTFVYPALRRIIPPLHLITHSIKYLSVVIFITPLLAAFALAHPQKLSDENRVARQKKFIAVGVILLALLAGILFWAWRFPYATDDVRRTLINGLSRAFFLAGSGLLLFFLTSKEKLGFRRFLPLLLIIIAWLDVLTHEPTQNPTVAAAIYQPGLARTRLALQPEPALGGTRAMFTPTAYLTSLHFAASSPQNNYLVNRLMCAWNCNLLDNIPKVDGFLSLCPREADDVNTLLYSATNVNYPRLEDFLGVSQINISNQIYSWQSRKTFLPLVTAGQKPYFFDDFSAWSALSQTNFDSSKLVILPEEDKASVAVTNQTTARVINPKFEIQRVSFEVDAAVPSLVVIAQSWYPDWRAYIDNQPTRLFRANYAFQAVQVPGGHHLVRLVYQDRAFQIGSVVSAMTWLVCLFALCIPIFHRRQR